MDHLFWIHSTAIIYSFSQPRIDMEWFYTGNSSASRPQLLVRGVWMTPHLAVFSHSMAYFEVAETCSHTWRKWFARDRCLSSIEGLCRAFVPLHMFRGKGWESLGHSAGITESGWWCASHCQLLLNVEHLHQHAAMNNIEHRVLWTRARLLSGQDAMVWNIPD